MKISLLSIGDEVVFGEIADTNAAWISGRLYDCGEKVVRHFTVGDREQDIVEAVRYLAENSDLVIATGGLGPTVDDITASAAARAVGTRLVLNDQAMGHIERVTCKLGGNLRLNEKQALLPARATVVPNPVGTACGFRVEFRECTLFFLPGVPAEMRAMVVETVLPFVRESAKGHTILRTKVLRVFGIAEAELDPLLAHVASPGSGVTVAYAVQFPEILVKIRAEGRSERLVASHLDHAVVSAREILRDVLFAEDDLTMDMEVARLLRQSGLTLSLAESCTGGLVAKRITDLAGSSAYFVEGAVTYSNGAKMRTLGVPESTLVAHGAVSAETAVAMARGMKSRSGSDIAISITGIAGPEGGSADKPVGTVYIALADGVGCTPRRFNFAGSRREVRAITAFAVLDMLRRYICSLP